MFQHLYISGSLQTSNSALSAFTKLKYWTASGGIRPTIPFPHSSRIPFFEELQLWNIKKQRLSVPLSVQGAKTDQSWTVAEITLTWTQLDRTRVTHEPATDTPPPCASHQPLGTVLSQDGSFNCEWLLPMKGHTKQLLFQTLWKVFECALEGIVYTLFNSLAWFCL